MLESLGHVLGRERVRGRSGGHDPAAGQQERVGGGGGELLQVVRHQHGGDRRVRLGEQVDRLEQLLARRDVQAGRRLVEQDQPGLADLDAADFGWRPGWEYLLTYPPVRRGSRGRYAGRAGVVD